MIGCSIPAPISVFLGNFLIFVPPQIRMCREELVERQTLKNCEKNPVELPKHYDYGRKNSGPDIYIDQKLTDELLKYRRFSIQQSSSEFLLEMGNLKMKMNKIDKKQKQRDLFVKTLNKNEIR